MLKILFSVKLEALKSWFSGALRKNKRQSKGAVIGFSLLMLYALGCLGFLFWHIFDTIAVPFHAVGFDWLFFSFAAVMAFALMFVGSVFTAKAQLFEARDNDLMLSLPIKPAHILISRLFMLWVIDAVLDLLVAVPVFLVWQREVGFSSAGLAAYIVIFLLLPLLALASAALFGWLISIITAGMKRKALVTTALSFVFLGAYMVLCARMNTLLTELAADATGMAKTLGAVAPVYMTGAAIAEGDMAALAAVAGVIVAAFALVCLLLDRTFIRTATGQRGGAKTKYVERTVSAVSPDRALLRREMRRLFSSSSYTLNAGLGIVMAVVAAIVLLIKRDVIVSAFSAMPMAADILTIVLLAALCFCASTILITAPSVSLEGKSLWIARSLPVETWSILRAKLRLHCVLSIPALLVASAICCVVLKPTAAMGVLVFLLPAVLCVFTGLLGLAENLRHPNLDWISETQAVKSGVGVLFTMFISWGIMLIPVLVWLIWGDVIPLVWLAGGFTALIAVLCAALYRLLRTWGVRKFEEL